MLDLDDLLRSFGEDAPSGEDLEYDPEFTELQLASHPGEEKVVGDSVISAEDPDFAEVTRLATSLLERTKDIRIAVILANAALRTEGLSAFEETLCYIRRCLEEQWESIHPQLDEEDDNDPTMRVNAVIGLTDREGVLASLRSAPLTNSRSLGTFCLRDLQLANGEIETPPEAINVPNQQTISAAFQDSDAEHLTRLVQATSASFDHVKAITAIFEDRIGALGPDLAPLQKTLYDIGRKLSTYVENDTAEPIEEPLDNETQTLEPTAATRPANVGSISSPDDVKKAIDRIVEYYARYEPSSPLPLLLNRARRLVSADFVTIMRDMAPQGIENVSLIGGLEANEENED
ncbi:type VI secretion system protein TssA [Roseibium algae]|uniref:Type VI secretion system protein TssA n=1 Tax=Roseibium algae TaxID=3123038 RepID=A0ABU8TF24_9HYPH